MHCKWLGILLTSLVIGLIGSAQADATKEIRVGVLAFGTVNWELDTVNHHGLDRQHGIDLKITKLSGKNASAVALQGKAVDAIVTDWIWVSRQRSGGADFTFVPHSTAVGGLMVRPDAGIKSLQDLRGRKIGIAGGPVDKSWLMLQAFSKRETGVNLEQEVKPTFAAPPLLNKIMLRGDIPAVLNFWHYTARLEAAGMTRLIGVKDLLPTLGVSHQPPVIGWVFSERWAAQNKTSAIGFFRALRAAKQLLATSDEEWQRLRPLMKAESESTFIALRDSYRAGIPTSFDDSDIAAARALFGTLSTYGGKDLVGDQVDIAPGTFWSGFRY